MRLVKPLSIFFLKKVPESCGISKTESVQPPGTRLTEVLPNKSLTKQPSMLQIPTIQMICKHVFKGLATNVVCGNMLEKGFFFVQSVPKVSFSCMKPHGTAARLIRYLLWTAQSIAAEPSDLSSSTDPEVKPHSFNSNTRQSLKSQSISSVTEMSIGI